MDKRLGGRRRWRPGHRPGDRSFALISNRDQKNEPSSARVMIMSQTSISQINKGPDDHDHNEFNARLLLLSPWQR